MNVKKNQFGREHASKETSSIRNAYAPPQLLVYGSLSDLTNDAAGATDDLAGGSQPLFAPSPTGEK